MDKETTSLASLEPTPERGADPALALCQTPAFTEDLALALLKNRDLALDEVEQITGNASLMKSRKVRLALVAHPSAPRRLVLRLVRELYPFDLMKFALTPSAPADLRRFAEELLVTRLPSLAFGDRISLARRSSQLVAAALLLDQHSRVWQTALENPRLTEAAVVKALLRPAAAPAFVEAICHHPKWSLRSEIRVALLRSPHTPLARTIEFSRRIPPAQLRDILHASRLPEKIKEYLRHDYAGQRVAVKKTRKKEVGARK